MISRRQARRQALFLVYQWDLSGRPLGSQYAGELDPWAFELAEETVANAAALDARITAAAEGWTADRLGAVERSALRVAICELDRGEVPRRGRDQRGGRATPSATPPRRARGSSTASWAASSARRRSGDERRASRSPQPRSCSPGSRRPARGSRQTDDPEQAIEVLAGARRDRQADRGGARSGRARRRRPMPREA